MWVCILYFSSWKSPCPLCAMGLIQSLMKPLHFNSDLVFAVCSQSTGVAQENKDSDTLCKSFMSPVPQCQVELFNMHLGEMVGAGRAL